MSLGTTQILAIVAVVVVAGAGVGAGIILMGQDNGQDNSAPEVTVEDVAKNILKSINDTNINQLETFATTEDSTKNTATLCTDTAIGSKTRWITVSNENIKASYDAVVAEAKFAANITNDTITVMSKTFDCNHITNSTGLTDGCGYWYIYTGSYTILEYTGYLEGVYFLHIKIKLGTDTTTASDVNAIIKATISQINGKIVAADIANGVIKAVNATNSNQKETYALIEGSTDTDATVCTDTAIGSKTRQTIISKTDVQNKYIAAKADEKFTANITNDTITVMSKTFDCNHITIHDGLTDGCGYWYIYTGNYTIIEYMGYLADNTFIHTKIKLGVDTTTESEINAIIKAAILAL